MSEVDSPFDPPVGTNLESTGNVTTLLISTVFIPLVDILASALNNSGRAVTCTSERLNTLLRGVYPNDAVYHHTSCTRYQLDYSATHACHATSK